MCWFRLDNLRAPKCIAALQVMQQLLCLPVFRGMLKKKKRWPTAFVGFNFLCVKMSRVMLMLVVSSAGVAAVTCFLGERGRLLDSVCLALQCSLLFPRQI